MVTRGGDSASLGAAYLGVNYRIDGDRLRIMSGVEYSRMEGHPDRDTFAGWTWLSGVRFYF